MTFKLVIFCQLMTFKLVIFCQLMTVNIGIILSTHDGKQTNGKPNDAPLLKRHTGMYFAFQRVNQIRKQTHETKQKTKVVLSHPFTLSKNTQHF